MCKYATCQLVEVHSISPCLPFRGKASKLPVHKDTSKVQRTKTKNITPTCKPFDVDIKHKVSFSNTHFIHILWRWSSAPGRLHTALTSNASPRVETRGGGNLRVITWSAERFGQWEEAVGIRGRYRVGSDKWLVGGQLPSSRGKVLWELSSPRVLCVVDVSSEELRLPSYISAAAPPSPLLFIRNNWKADRGEKEGGVAYISTWFVVLHLTSVELNLTAKLHIKTFNSAS